jgi:hypothetical protein
MFHQDAFHLYCKLKQIVDTIFVSHNGRVEYTFGKDIEGFNGAVKFLHCNWR